MKVSEGRIQQEARQEARYLSRRRQHQRRIWLGRVEATLVSLVALCLACGFVYLLIQLSDSKQWSWAALVMCGVLAAWLIIVNLMERRK